MEMPSKKDMTRALGVIEKIAMLADPDEKDENWSQVYKFSHSFHGSCGNSHEDWRAQLDQAEKDLKDF